MYSDKVNVNLLTALLVGHGIRHAVVCPGSRNAPIVHNLCVCPDIQCHPVTDERSAGFYALGMASFLGEAVAVCVTSGSALLNLLPAVAEAYYQHVPLIVISADRPPQWIDQLDGQTLPQPGALGCFVRKCVSLPEPGSAESKWYCQRLVDDALGVADAPVHINVPISEPLFGFSTKHLPKPIIDRRCEVGCSVAAFEPILSEVCKTRRPMLVLGSSSKANYQRFLPVIERHMVVLYEPLSHRGVRDTVHFDEVLASLGDDLRPYQPDVVIYVGETLVSKRLKAFLRDGSCKVIRVGREDHLQDTFKHQCCQVVAEGNDFLSALCDVCRDIEESAERAVKWRQDFWNAWQQQFLQAARHLADYEPAYSQMAAVKAFEQGIEALEDCFTTESGITVHYANSTAIRLANIYARHYVFCNRGVNGIEGSLSTAAGASVTAQEWGGRVFCVIGDLSFFYDQNALWNRSLSGNFRILLLNNGKGGIFNLLPGLEQSPARDVYVAAAHSTTAEGICRQNGVAYLRADDMEEMQRGIHALLTMESKRPVLLEVLTDADEDQRVFVDYYRSLQP